VVNLEVDIHLGQLANSPLQLKISIIVRFGLGQLVIGA
jgi:hypothetical protein